MTSMMTSQLTILLLLMLTSNVRTAELQFTSSPTEIQTPVTDTLDMRCSLTDVIATAVTSSVLVGRRDVGGTHTAETKTKRNFQLPPNETIKVVTSMSILHAGVPIATVSQYTPAAVESDLHKDNLKVKGDLTPAKGEFGYLELVWDFPKDSQTGEYKCFAATITERGHPLTLSTSLTVQKASASVSLDDLLREFRDLKQSVKEQNITDSQHLAMIAGEKAKNLQLEAALAQLQKEVVSLRSGMQESRHVETGTVDCGSSNHWPKGSGNVTHNSIDNYRPAGQEVHVMGHFNKPFSSAPVVFLSTSYLVVNKANHVWYGIELVSVTTDTFTVRCDTAGPESLVQTLEIDWVAIPV